MYRRRFIIMLAVLVAVAAGMSAIHEPFTSPVEAKGPVRTPPNQDSSEAKKEEPKREEPKREEPRREEPRREEPRREEPRPAPAREEPRREEPRPAPAPQPREEPRREEPRVQPREEPREQPRPAPTPAPAPAPAPAQPRQPAPQPAPRTGGTVERRDNPTPPRIEDNRQQRPEGTPDVRGQVTKREERRDTEYEFNRRYQDPFYYPYDYDLYRYYPYYDRGSVIVVERDTWSDSRRRWRGTYDYARPLPGSLEEALVDIKAAWMENDPEFLMMHVDHLGRMDMYRDGKFSHSLTPRQVYKLTAEALDRIRTVDFRYTSVDRQALSARVKARHVFRGPDRRERTAYLTFYMARVRDRWVVERMDIRETDYGLPKCFIASAAYGTPMAAEVMVLRQFRERYLLTNRPGRVFVATYYKISPPIAGWIEKSEIARKAVRRVLNPVIQLCKLVMPSAGT